MMSGHLKSQYRTVHQQHAPTSEEDNNRWPGKWSVATPSHQNTPPDPKLLVDQHRGPTTHVGTYNNLRLKQTKGLAVQGIQSIKSVISDWMDKWKQKRKSIDGLHLVMN